MRITKYPQSNFLIEKDNTRILIDPGFLTFEKYKPEDFGKLDAIFITHQHPDHLDNEAVAKFKRDGIAVYGNFDVVKVLGADDLKINEVDFNQEFGIGGLKIRAIEIPHCKLLFCKKCVKQLAANELIPKIKKCKIHANEELDEVAGPPNTGFFINGIFFHPGDGIKMEIPLITENTAIPITGPTIGYDKAWEFANSLNAKVVIPMHYSHSAFPADPVKFASQAGPGVEVRILADGEGLEI